MLFLALKKVRVVKTTPSQIPTTQLKNLSCKFPIPLSLTTIWKTLDRGLGLSKFAYLFQVKLFQLFYRQNFFRVVS